MYAWTVVGCNRQKVPNIVQALKTPGIMVECVQLEQTNEQPVRSGCHLRRRAPVYQACDSSHTSGQFAFIDRLTVLVLGICLRHQVMALRHGADVYLGKECRQRETMDLLDKQHPFLTNLDANVDLVTDHCKGMTLPENFPVSGQSAHYGVKIMVCPVGKQFGVQFHPDIPGTPGDLLFRNFTRIVAAFHYQSH